MPRPLPRCGLLRRNAGLAVCPDSATLGACCTLATAVLPPHPGMAILRSGDGLWGEPLPRGCARAAPAASVGSAAAPGRSQTFVETKQVPVLYQMAHPAGYATVNFDLDTDRRTSYCHHTLFIYSYYVQDLRALQTPMPLAPIPPMSRPHSPVPLFLLAASSPHSSSVLFHPTSTNDWREAATFIGIRMGSSCFPAISRGHNPCGGSAGWAPGSRQGFLTRAELLETVSQNENKITQRPEPVSRMTLPLTESKPVSSSESNFAAIPGSAVTFENSPNKLLSSSSTVLPTLVPRDVSSPSDSHSGSTALEVVQDSPFRTQIPLQPSDNPVGRLSSMTPGFTVIGTISSLADERIINSNLVRPSTRFVPFIKPSPKPKITDLAFSQDLNYQSDSVYYDDGSGEYSETVTFEGPDMEDVSSVTNVPPNMDDVEDLNYESYDTSFPSRPMLPLSSVYIPHSAATQAFQTFKDSQSQDSLDSTVSSYSSVENNSQIDYAEPFTIEPTELLLPDMNSLEYYSTLLAMENASLPEQAGQTENHTSTAYTSNGTAEPDQMHSVISASMLMENLSQVNISVGTKVSDLLSPSFDSGAPSTSSSFDEFTLKPSSSIAFSNTLSFDTGTLPMSLEPSPNLSQFSFTEMSSFSTSLSSAEKGIVSETSNIYSFSSEQSTVEPTMAMKASTISSLSYWEGWFTSIAGTDPLKAFTKTSVPFPQLTTSETEATRIFSSTLADFPYFSLSVQPTRMLPDVDSTASLVVTSSHHKTVMLWFGSSSATTDIKSSTTGIPGVSLTESLVVSSSSSSEAVPLSTIISVPPNPGTAAPQINTATDEIHTGFSVTLVSNKITTTGNTPSTPTASTSTSTSGTNIPSTSAVFTSSEPNIATSSSLTTSATLSPGSTNLATTSTTTVTTTTTTQPFLCDVTISDTYLVRAGPVIYTAIAVINAMQLSKQDPSIITSVRPSVTVPDYHFQVHTATRKAFPYAASWFLVTVLQFVPTYVDVRFCNFSQRIEKGLTMAFSEVRRRVQDTDEFTVQVLNITMNASYLEKLQRHPVDIAFAIRDTFGFLNGSRVSNLLRNLSMVEFSFYLGYPVLQIAELLLGVLEHRLLEKTFQAEMERKLALLLEEVLLPVGRWKRATSVGNNSVQIVKTSRIEGADNPLEMIYFVEGQNGQRLRATTASSLINRIDLQKAAIVLGYRVQEKLAQRKCL
ncbi:K1549 protein, partial [Polypterus senegalus]